MAAPGVDGPGIMVDGHVHVYDSYDTPTFFDAAYDNFRRAAQGFGVGGDWSAVMILTEGAGQDEFSRFAKEAGTVVHGAWTFQRTREEHSLIARRGSAERLALIAGRQIASAEDLEVLVFPTSTRIAEGSTLSEVLSAASEADLVAMIPWGFGKWWLGRQEVLREALGRRLRTGVYLADSGNRPRFLPRPRLLRWAESASRVVLAGSDPLPLAGHERRAGSYGFQLSGPLDYETPARCVVERLRALASSPRVYGDLERLMPFVRSQIEMQVMKRWRRRGS